MQYGLNFSGPGNDIFRTDRATGEPSDAHNSNFLHPVFYYYDRLPSGKLFYHKVHTSIVFSLNFLKMNNPNPFKGYGW